MRTKQLWLWRWMFGAGKGEVRGRWFGRELVLHAVGLKMDWTGGMGFVGGNLLVRQPAGRKVGVTYRRVQVRRAARPGGWRLRRAAGVDRVRGVMMTAEISKERAEEVLEKRIEASRSRVNYLSARVILRSAEAGIEKAENELMKTLADLDQLEKVTMEGLTTKVEPIKERLETSLAELELIDRDHDSALDFSDATDSIRGILERIDGVCSMASEKEEFEEEKEVNIADDVEHEGKSKLQYVDDVKKTFARVGKDLEKRVGEFVKEDGSIDFSNIKKTAQVSLDKSSETWARLNGLTPEGASLQQAIEDSPVVWDLRTEIEKLEKNLQESSRSRERSLRKEDQLGKLIKARELREMDDQVNTIRRMLAVRVLELELERIYLYLKQESETTSDFMEERLLIKEFGILDERLAVLNVFLDEQQVLLLDDSEIGELAGDVKFMKSRVGIESDFYTTTLDWPKAKRIMSESMAKIREGGLFFWRGVRLLGGDIVYAWQLIRKAAVGFTLSPREVRTLRRTGRDIVTFVPFTIILILPISPIGHVLVFSFIQRVFPDFFPTTFSERRQKLMMRSEQLRERMSVNPEHKSSDGARHKHSDGSRSMDEVHLAE